MYIPKHGKGRLNKLLPLLLIFWLPSPMPQHDSLSAKRKFESLLYRPPFLFHFQLPSRIFYKYVKMWKTQRFLHVNCFFLCTTLSQHILSSSKMVAKNGMNIYLLENKWCCFLSRKNDDCLFKLWQNHVTKSKQNRRKCNFPNQLTISAL